MKSNKKIISIVKYNSAGNTGSLYNALNKLIKNDYKILITNEKKVLNKSDAIILPGVGFFKETMLDLEKNEIIKIVKKHVLMGKPLLGICIGMHLLFDKSEEGNYHGIGLLKGEIKKIKKTKLLPIIGWKKNILSSKNKLIKNTSSYYYFVHSYELKNCNNKIIKMYYSDTNNKIISYIENKNIFGTQFHPELSSDDGINFLKQFICLI